MGQDGNKEIKDFSEFNENEQKTYPNLWGIIKALLREKLLALSDYIRKLESSD